MVLLASTGSARHLIKHRQPPMAKNDLAPNVSSAKAEKPWNNAGGKGPSGSGHSLGKGQEVGPGLVCGREVGGAGAHLDLGLGPGWGGFITSLLRQGPLKPVLLCFCQLAPLCFPSRSPRLLVCEMGELIEHTGSRGLKCLRYIMR